MGLLNFFSRTDDTLAPLPSGSFTLDRDGSVMTSTLPQSYPAGRLREIGQHVLASFRAAREAQMPLSELIVQFAALKLLARELRGGAIVFVMPQSHHEPSRKTNAPALSRL